VGLSWSLNVLDLQLYLEGPALRGVQTGKYLFINGGYWL